MRPEFEEAESSSVLPKILLALGLLAIGGMAYFFWMSSSTGPDTQVVDLPIPEIAQPEPEPEPVPESITPPTNPEPITEAEPEIAVQTEAPPPEPLPSLDESDAFTLEKVSAFSNGEALVRLLVPDNMVLKFVRGVMALDEGIVVHDYRPVQSPEPDFKVQKIDEPLDIEIGQRYRLDPANYTRYTPWVSALTQVDKASLAKFYGHALPLLEEAYEQHGIDRGSFHNVMLDVIDQLLAAPVLNDEVVLIQPKVYFQYQDPTLERAPEAHRLFFRMGPDHTQAVQASLRELKQQLLTLNIPRS